MDLEDEYGTGQLGFVLRRGARSVRICMGQSRAPGVGGAAAARPRWTSMPVEPEDPDVLEDLVVELLADSDRQEARSMSSVMAVFDFHGDSDELAARYDAAIHQVVAVSSARPVIHLAVPREYGFMVVDVWSSEEALRAFEQNEEFRRVLRDAGTARATAADLPAAQPRLAGRRDAAVPLMQEGRHDQHARPGDREPGDRQGRRGRTGSAPTTSRPARATGTSCWSTAPGPGVTAYANWRGVLPVLGEDFHVVAPDMVGFGYSDRPKDVTYGLDTWADQTLGVMDALGIEKAHLVGNSFGGAIALRLATRNPDRVDKLVLMGSVGVPFEITEGLDAVWGYDGTLEGMKKIMGFFAYDKSLTSGDLAQARYEGATQPGFQEAFSSMFPAPRQRWVDSIVVPEEEIRRLPHRTLIVHGREDAVIPLSNSYRLLELIDNGDLSVFSHCGHWTQIERKDDFNRLVRDFFLGT